MQHLLVGKGQREKAVPRLLGICPIHHSAEIETHLTTKFTTLLSIDNPIPCSWVDVKNTTSSKQLYYNTHLLEVTKRQNTDHAELQLCEWVHIMFAFLRVEFGWWVVGWYHHP